VDTADVRDRPIRPVGIEPSGELEIPDETEIGWYRLGSSPGRPGATVLAAHVSWNRSLGPFARLAVAKPGDPVELTLADGSVRRYRIVELAQYPKGALPTDRIFSTIGDERLVLITCGGSFNPSIRRYLDNIVAYAEPDPG
jgi:sortase (surface protein transpeptidase)